MTPKSTLRRKLSFSSLEDLSTGSFQTVIGDPDPLDSKAVERVVICSGKVFYDLDSARDEAKNDSVAIVRMEQFYPFPGEKLKSLFGEYSNASEIVWTQEEPKNMGGWSFVEPRITEIKHDNMTLKFVGRVASASPATGSYVIHGLEQKEIVDKALSVLGKVAPANS